MTDLEKFKDILSSKEDRLVKVTEKIDEIGSGKLDDPKLVTKRVKLRRESTDLIWMIKDLKEIIKSEESL
jgi:hypothetical protein